MARKNNNRGKSSRQLTSSAHDPCWCGLTDKPNCCLPLLAQQQNAKTPEALMRSRYSAFVEHNEPYILRTWHPEMRPKSILFEEKQQWLGLKVLKSVSGNIDDMGEYQTLIEKIGVNLNCDAEYIGIVEFVARSKINGRGHRHHEVSHFAKMDGLWLYTQGKVIEKN